jgi:hypothetical protein
MVISIAFLGCVIINKKILFLKGGEVMKRVIGIVVVACVAFAIILSGICFAAEVESSWVETYFGNYSTEIAYVKKMDNEKGKEKYCYIVPRENGEVEIGAEEPDKEDSNHIVVSRTFISACGEIIENSSSTCRVLKVGYYPEEQGYDVFIKNCYRSAIKDENISADIREKIKKAFKIK